MTLSYAPPTLENGVFCPACQNFKHPLNRCPQVQFVPNREAVIKKYCMTENQKQNKEYPRQNKIISEWQTWANKDLTSQYASVFQNENQQAIAMQSKIQLNFEYGSDTNSSVDDAASPGIKIPQNSPIFQAQHIKQSRKSRLVQDPQFQNKADSRQNLNLALQNRKQSILTAGISLGFAKTNTPKNKIEIPLIDEIKESDSSSSSGESEESTEKQKVIDYKKLVEKRAQATQDFNDNMTDNITNLYHQLQTQLEVNENDVIAKKALQQFEPLYWQFNQQKFDDFETKSQFDYYFNKQNAEDVIQLMKEDIFGWQTTILDRMRKFMLYPFQYVLNFLKLRRNDKLKFVAPLKMVAKIKNTLETLKKTLKKKKEQIVRSSLKFNSVAPDENKTKGEQRKWVV